MAPQQHSPLSYALFLLKLKDRSCFDVRRKMKEKGYDSSDIETVIETLQQKKFLDDERFAERLVYNYSKYRLKGRNAIRLKLSQSGISSDIIAKVLTDIEEGENVAEEAAVKWLAKKEGKEDEKLKEKLFRHLTARGFSYEEIKKVVEKRNL